MTANPTEDFSLLIEDSPIHPNHQLAHFLLTDPIGTDDITMIVRETDRWEIAYKP